MSERTIFMAALDIEDPEERWAYVVESCRESPDLRRRVEALIHSHEQTVQFLNSPPPGIEVTDRRPVAEVPGDAIGPYKLLGQIGEGGFGVVYLAEQERPVRRKVALKIIKPGMDTRQVIGRFEAERQALAMMDHPNIAKVLDAGTTGEERGQDSEVRGRGRETTEETPYADNPKSEIRNPQSFGRPYFVMELVQGVPITEYCDQCGLTTRERLDLFVTVCQAVQHAHQKGIIHRDIKPSNILVAMQDGRAAPKVIDFGVAKAIDQRLTEHTLTNVFAQMVGTPLYMSPEQAELSPLGVDTRSDIYSLGVLLYELLTGNTPFDKQRLHEASYDELRRIIREEEPPRPSARISTLAADLATTIAERHRTDARRLQQSVRGELDWIVMKALDKDRNRRYETAGSLARDIERYLNDEPVQACPPSVAYRCQKFARRNRAALLIACATVATLLFAVIGLAASNRLIRAERNEKAAALSRAEVESKRAEENFLRASIAIRETLAKAALGSGEWSTLPQPLRKRFAEEAVKFYTSLLEDDSSDPNRRYEAAVGHRAIGTLHATTGEPHEAEESFRRSIELLEPLVTLYPAVQQYRHQLAWSWVNLSRTLHNSQRTQEGTKILQRAAKLYEMLLSERPESTDYQDELSTCYVDLSARLTDLRDFQQADMILSRGILLFKNTTAQAPDLGAYEERIARMYLSLGRLRAADQRFPEARSAYQAAAQHFETSFSAMPTASRLYGWGDCYKETIEFAGRDLQIPDLEQIYRRFFEVRERTPDNLRAHLDLREQAGHVHRNWAFTLRGVGRLKEADTAFAAAAAIFDKLAVDSPNVDKYWAFAANTHLMIANLMAQSDRREEAKQEFRRSIELREQLLEMFPNHSDNISEGAETHLDFAVFLAQVGQFEEAAKHHDKGCAILEKSIQTRPDAADCNELAWRLAASPVKQFRNPARAVELAENAVKLAPKDGINWNTLGVAQYRAGDLNASIEALGKSMALRDGGDAFDWFLLAMADWQLGHKDEARTSYDKAVDWSDKHLPNYEELRRFRAEAAELLGVTEPTPPADRKSPSDQVSNTNDATPTSPPTTNN